MDNSGIDESSIAVSTETISEVEEKMTRTSAIGNCLDCLAECSDQICSESNSNEHFVMGEDTEINLDANCAMQLGIGEETKEDISASGVGSNVVVKNEVPLDNFCVKSGSGEQPAVSRGLDIKDDVNGLLPPDVVPEVCLGQLICDKDVLVISGPDHFQNDLLNSTEYNLDKSHCQPTSENTCASPLPVLKSPSCQSTVNVDGDSRKRGLDACEMFACSKRLKTTGTAKASEFTDDVDFYEKMRERNVIPMGYRESVEKQVTDYSVDKIADSAVDKETKLAISDVNCTTSLSKDTENFKKDVIECRNSYMSEEDMIEVEEAARERLITEKDLDECHQSNDVHQYNNYNITSHEIFVETLDNIKPSESDLNVEESVTTQAQGDGLSEGLDSTVINNEKSTESEKCEQPQILTDTENPKGVTPQCIDSYVNDEVIEMEDVAKEGIVTSKGIEACCHLLPSNDVGQCEDNVETISHDENILRTYDSNEHPDCYLDTGECISSRTRGDGVSKSLDETDVTNSAVNVESDLKMGVSETSASLECSKTTDASKSSEIDWDFITEMRKKNVIPMGYRESVEKQITDCVVELCNANKDESIEKEKFEQPKILTGADNSKGVTQSNDSYMNDEDLIVLDDAANEGSGTDKDMEEFYQSLKSESEGGLPEVVTSEIGNDFEDVTEMTEIEIDEENADTEGVVTGPQREEKAPRTKKKSKSAEQNSADKISKTNVPTTTENPEEGPDDLLDMDVVDIDSGSDDEGVNVSEERIEVLCSKKVDLLITSVRGKKGKDKRRWPNVESRQGPDNYGPGYESWPHPSHPTSHWHGGNEAYAEGSGATSQKLGPPPMRDRQDFGPPGPGYGPGPGFNPVGEGSGAPYDMPPQNYPPMPQQGYHGEQPPYGDVSHQQPGFNSWGQQSQWQYPMPPYGQVNQQYQDWCSWWQSYSSWYQNYMMGWNQQQPPPPQPDPAHYSSQGSWASTQQQRHAATPASMAAPSASDAPVSARSKKNESKNSAKVTYKPTVAKGPVLHTVASPPSGPRLRFSLEGGAISSSSIQKASPVAAASRSAESSATKNLVAGTSQIDQEAENNLWVGNLPSGILAVDVRALMSRYGKVLKCRVGSMKSQKDAGLFALVTMETERDVTFCIKMLHNSYYKGQKLLVKKLKQQ